MADGGGLAHLFGDYVAQSHWAASEKTKAHGPALVHAASYTACFLPVTRNWRALAVIGGTHFVIDRWRLARQVVWAKNQLAPARWRYPHRGAGPTGYGPGEVAPPDWLAVPLLIAADNAMHLLVNRWALRRWARG